MTAVINETDRSERAMKRQRLSERDPAMDILRCLACFGVISVHFFLNIGFYKTEINNRRMYGMVFIRSFFMFCVPVFLLLTGYLNCHKKPERSHYKKLGGTLYTYIAAALFALYAYPKLYAVLREAFGLKKVSFTANSIANTAAKILSFDTFYGWYIEMYIGLFLMIPFLNILYNNIGAKKAKKLLILTCLFLTALPAVLNVYNFKYAGWFSDPAMTTGPDGKAVTYSKLIPSFWTALYPVTYYFIGCYLREYGLKLKSWVNALLITGWAGINGLYNLWRNYGAKFKWGDWADWGSLFNVIQAVLIFVFFMNLKYKKLPLFLKWCFMKLSGLTLGIYLFSWSVDRLCYPFLEKAESVIHRRINYYFIIVTAVFALSAVLSYIALKLKQLAVYGFAAIRSKRADSH